MREDLQEILNTQNDQVLQSYKRLISFVDATFSQAFKLSGDERAEFLVKNLISLRDFMSSEIIIKQTKDSIGDFVLASFDKFVKDHDLNLEELSEIRRKKKEKELKEEQLNQESLSGTDLKTSLEEE